jgi:hypothetical protein
MGRQPLQQIDVLLIKSRRFIDNVKASEQIAVTANDGHRQKAGEAQKLPHLLRHLRIVCGIIGEIGTAMPHHPTGYALPLGEAEIDLFHLAGAVVFMETELAPLHQPGSAGLRAGQPERRLDQVTQHRRHIKFGVDLPADPKQHLQSFTLVFQGGSGLHPLGDIAHDAQHKILAIDMDARTAHLHGQNPSILAGNLALSNSRPPLLHLREKRAGLLRGKKIIDRHGQQLILAIAGHGTETVVDEDIASIQIGQRNPIEGLFDDGPQQSGGTGRHRYGNLVVAIIP